MLYCTNSTFCRFFFLTIFISQVLFSLAQTSDSTIYVKNLKIVDGYTEALPDGSSIKVYDGKTGVLICDSLKVSIRWFDGVKEIFGYYGRIPVRDEYLFKFSAPGYDSLEIRHSMRDAIKHRSTELIFTKPYYVWQKTIALDEVTVKASKILMVNRGDTIVYNAANFRLRQGSMLDDLIRLLPGAEIDDNGQISVNGQFVNSVLIQGRDFFNGDPRVALRNLPAYTVNKIKVYHKAPDRYKDIGNDRIAEERQRDPLVMDVRLKRDYQQGLISNYEAGGGMSLDGEKGKWLTRLFALRYTNHSSFAVYGSANNISEDTSPGDKGEWQRNTTNGDLKIYKGGVSLQLNPKDSRFAFKTSLDAKHQNAYLLATDYCENYFPSGNTFRKGSSINEQQTSDFTWNGNIDWKVGEHHNAFLISNASYSQNKDNGSNYTEYLEGSDSLYSRTLDTFVEKNRWKAHLELGGVIFKGGLNLFYGAILNYSRQKEKKLRHDQLEYINDLQQDINQWYKFDIPNHQYAYNLYGTLTKRLNNKKRSGIKKLSFTYNYKQNFNADNQKLWLAGEYAVPSSVMPDQVHIDLANTYHTTRMERSHLFSPKASVDLLNTSFTFQGWLSFWNRKIVDYRNASLSSLSRFNVTVQPSLDITYKIKNNYSNRLEINGMIAPELPDLLHLLNVRDSSDPLHLILGNPNLKTMFNYLASTKFYYSWKPLNKRLYIDFQYRRSDNAVGIAQMLDRATGVTTSKPMNLDGNWHMTGKINYSQFIDKDNHWNIANDLSYRYQHSVDFTGTGQGADFDQGFLEKRSVNTTSLHENFRLVFRMGQWNIAGISDFNWQWSRSKSANFSNIFLREFKYGINVSFPTILGFDCGTDLMIYSRQGYTFSNSNTNEWVWNATLTRSFGKRKLWTLKATGFDILKQLSDYRQSVNAQGRVETWTNSTPSYIVASLTYRLDMKPKKK